MNKNKTIIYITVLLTLGLIIVPSILLINNNHNQKLIVSNEKYIIEAAKNCYYSESCILDSITLEELNEKVGLIYPTNPITKKIYNKNSYIDVKNNFKFIEVE